MRSIYFDKTLACREVQRPVPHKNEALIRVDYAGICNTDIEITRGYVPGFSGIPGHEFIGRVETAPGDDRLLGKRVTAEINCACGGCPFCAQGLGRHCPNRTVIGIDKRNGAFADYIAVPAGNVVPVPDAISDDNALFIEPLAAALEIQEQIAVPPESEVLVIGDGKLAHLIALTLSVTGCRLLLFGKHQWKVRLLCDRGITASIDRGLLAGRQFDIVVEASGSPDGFREGFQLVKPRGTLVLKSTFAQSFPFNPAAVVVNEITLLGSRCGRFDRAVDFLQKNRIDLSYLISRRFPLADGVAAFEAAQRPDVLKVIIDCR